MWTTRARVLVAGAILAGLTLGMIAGAMPAGAQTRSLSGVRVLAVAPFADPDPSTRETAARADARLSELLRGGRFQIIDSARVAQEMRRLGLTSSDLISPSRTVELGRSLGADAVLTGRVVQIVRDKRFAPGPALEARVAIDVRVLEVGTRLKLFEREVQYSDFGGSFAAAVEGFARDVVSMLRN
jgi:hypothetical protein